jgi:hypothetical protein
MQLIIANIFWQDGSTADSLMVNSSGVCHVIINECFSCDTVVVNVNGALQQYPFLSDCPLQGIIVHGSGSQWGCMWNDGCPMHNYSGPGTLASPWQHGTDNDSVVVMDGGSLNGFIGQDTVLCQVLQLI